MSILSPLATGGRSCDREEKTKQKQNKKANTKRSEVQKTGRKGAHIYRLWRRTLGGTYHNKNRKYKLPHHKANTWPASVASDLGDASLSSVQKHARHVTQTQRHTVSVHSCVTRCEILLLFCWVMLLLFLKGSH